ncbi:iron-containing alcohol dehydrogenase [Thiovibrio frasassiensis]|uniref:Iron-containing alcohol dehydrogenase n=1 Tax=Thiovibrio frasassiensis TaxID=2984131 RepID=A0A9X4MF37_9BACT|nr:iron-containing alcohol dehydrogenase [Thiovibrio frasassiensis]MDG4475452.1 iron-containing alcohol dehydrogenase [Thiovibrio frasassiensis]
MFDFTFHNPTKIIFGADKESLIGSELTAAGITKVLLVYGRNSVVKSGLLDRVLANLTASGIGCTQFGGVDSNPVLSHTREGVALAKRDQVEAILAVGGGSVLDEAKAIAVGALSDKDVWQFFVGKEVERALPVFTVLTLAATGSEMNGNSVVTNAETKQKYNIASPHVYPKVSILNPELTHSVPLNYTAYSAVDAIAHVLEGYFTKEPGTHLQDRLVEGIIKTVIETTDLIMAEPSHAKARASFMWTATLALNGLTPAGIGEYSFPNHMIEHAMSAIYNIPHGAGLSIVLPAWMKWYEAKNPSQFARFAKEIFGLDSGKAGIAALEQWFVTIKSPVRLAEAEIPATDIEKIAENAEGLAKQWGIGGLYPKETIAEILRLAV